MQSQEEGQMGQHTVSVLAFQEGEQWSAQCLQYDIAVQANSLPELTKAFERALVGHIVVSLELGLEPFAGLSAAPKKFWDLYQQAEVGVKPKKRPPFKLPAGVQETPHPEFQISRAPLQFAMA